MFPSAPRHLAAPQGSQLSTMNLLPQPLWLCVQDKNKLLKSNHNASATSPEVERWPALNGTTGGSMRRGDASFCYYPLQSANLPVAPPRHPREGGSATRATPMPQNQLEGTCPLPAIASSQGATVLTSLPNNAIDFPSLQDPNTRACVWQEEGGGDKAGKISRLAM